MDNNGNLHAGHRERMLNKLLSNPNGFSDHELLETLLFHFIPRKNTNELAHKLIRTFGSINKVLNASATELMSVEGVGKKVASSLILCGKLLRVVSDCEEKPMLLDTFSRVNNVLMKHFQNMEVEGLALILLGKKYQHITTINFCDENKKQVSADITEVAKAFAIHQPTYAIIAHNHTSSSVAPSREDDLTTKKINLLCSAHNVNLIDHVIVSKQNSFSYRNSGRLDKLKEASDLDKILNEQGEY